MKKPYLILFVCEILLAAPFANLNGDFAPIAVGNMWRYAESYNSQINGAHNNYYSAKGSGRVTIHILDSLIKNDTVVFSAHYRDSIYSRIVGRTFGIADPPVFDSLPDTTIEFDFKIFDITGNSSIITSPASFLDSHCTFFSKHYYPDSEVAEQIYNGKNTATITDIGGIYGENVGLLSCWDGVVTDYRSLTLQEFNNQKYELGIKRINPKVKAKKMYLGGSYFSVHGKIWDILGKQFYESEIKGQ